LIFGNVPIGGWPPGDDHPGDLALRFVSAREAFHSSDLPSARAIWREITTAPGLESRDYLQAWSFLRESGQRPAADEAKRVLGLVAEIPMQDKHDLLAAYEDGSCRYLNYAGGVVIVDDRSVADVQQAINAWLEVGRRLVQLIGPWNQPELPGLPPGHARVTILTPSGPHFGQGPQQQLIAEPTARLFVDAAAALLQIVVRLSDPRSSA
jgi:hypothetical protein